MRRHGIIHTVGCMTNTMNDSRLVSIAQLTNFLKVGAEISFRGQSRDEVYPWIDGILNRFRYSWIRKKDKTIVKAYLRKMTGYSDAQITRLIAKKKETGTIKTSETKKNSFPKVYNPVDVGLLIKVDLAHGRLAGIATKQILEREYAMYGKKEYERLRHISSSHIYNLRATRQYRSKAGVFTKTNPTPIPIGERRKPENGGKPGFIRVDSVHQGDYIDGDGQKKGVYHINLVDEVTQWEIIGAVEGISERFLAPLLESLIRQFPFLVINFHSDNGSEYINKVVAALLNKLVIHQTKSRPRHSNDNGLAETKNGAVIRKHMGYAYIPQRYAKKINHFYQTFMNPYLNFHRPSGFPTPIMDQKKPGKIKMTYKNYLTPWQKLQTIPAFDKYLKLESNIGLLTQFEKQLSDTEAAEGMQKAKYQLFKSFREPACPAGQPAQPGTFN